MPIELPASRSSHSRSRRPSISFCTRSSHGISASSALEARSPEVRSNRLQIPASFAQEFNNGHEHAHKNSPIRLDRHDRSPFGEPRRLVCVSTNPEKSSRACRERDGHEGWISGQPRRWGGECCGLRHCDGRGGGKYFDKTDRAPLES